MIGMIISHELKALSSMESSGLLMIWMILGHELKVVNTMKTLGGEWHAQFQVVSLGYICYEQLKGVDDMNDSGSWAKCSRWYE